MIKQRTKAYPQQSNRKVLCFAVDVSAAIYAPLP